jgi:phosphoserine aminotransferase
MILMTMRVYNFGAGPAMLPEQILREAQQELLNWEHHGMSVLEIGHRTDQFQELMAQSEQLLRQLLAIPTTYRVLFLSGAARTQFAMIPINLLAKNQQAGYLVTGVWSSMAFDEANYLHQSAYCVASSYTDNFKSIPKKSSWQIKDNTRYLYYTPNETINGVRLVQPPIIDKTLPLIADMTSCLLSEPIDVNDYGLIFAGAQKNIANAGLTLVIIRDSLLESITNSPIPTMFDYRTYAKNHSLYATPPTFNCYLALKMFQWLEQQGGIEAIYRINCEKAQRLYDFIDASKDYYCDVAIEARSLMNVCFRLKNPTLEPLFLERATQQGLLALRGHRAVGGLRASIYNAMPLSGVIKLIDFMIDFANHYT